MRERLKLVLLLVASLCVGVVVSSGIRSALAGGASSSAFIAAASQIADGAITVIKLSNGGATNGQVLTSNGISWAAAAAPGGGLPEADANPGHVGLAYATGASSIVSLALPVAENNTNSVRDTADSVYVVYCTPATAGTAAGLSASNAFYTRRSRNPTLIAVVSDDHLTGTGNRNYWIGLGASSAPNSGTWVNSVAFRCSRAGIGDTTWQYYTNDGTTGSVVDSTVPCNDEGTATVRRSMKAVVSDSPAQVVFTIDGANSQTKTTNLPASATGLGVSVIMYTTDATSRCFNISRVELKQR